MHLSKRKKQQNQLLSLLTVGLIGGIFLVLIWPVKVQSFNIFAILVAIDLLVCYNIYSIFTKKFREREQLKKVPFPEEWRKILERDVVYYQTLSEEEKRRFETEIQIFLHETRITGIKTEIDDRTMVLAAASAEIPVFNFPEWEYENLGEILIYPSAFDRNFRQEGHGRNVLGMVGTGIMQGIMILSKSALIAGFENPGDKKNVGIHEFAHLLDAADGEYDGIPKVFLDNAYLEPWLEVMHKEIGRIHSGDSNMNPYGGTNKIEFFAVATEYFFEQPAVMQRNKPELYELMVKIFKQDTRNQLRSAVKSMFNYTGQKIGRNDPCPCNSGKKYKRCCLKNARQY
jgi:Mlc titration factor MtfA (ptsG expression regulator)